METLQLLNTAVIKHHERSIKANFEERLRALQDSVALEILQKTIVQTSTQKNITRDQAAFLVVEAIAELKSIWSEYIAAEGIDKLKTALGGKPNTP